MQEIQLVEDDDDIREMLAEILQSAGYVVHEARNGHEALEQLEARDRPCLLITDVMMPVMNGPELLSELERKNRLSSLAVLALSASDSAHAVPQANAFLSKPVLPEHLLQTVQKYCQPADPRVWVS